MKRTGLKYYKLKVLKKFNDIEAGFQRMPNDEFTATEQRAKEILVHDGLVEILSITK